MPNRTSDDAARRLWYAQPGSLIEASDGYLEALRSGLRRWLEEIEAEVASRRRGA